MRKVLIALDYNPTAQYVAEAGFSMAMAMNAEVTLLHVITDPVDYSSTAYSPIMGFNGYIETSQFQLDSVDGLKNAAQHFLRKTKAHLGDDAIKTQVNEGDIAESILEYANASQTDVIVIGSHSQNWLENILLGSVAEKVLNHTKVPLYIIPIKKPN